MDRVLEYRVKASDLEKTIGGILGKVLKQCMGLTPHEISHSKFTPGGITVLRLGNPEGKYEPATVKDRVSAGDTVRIRFSDAEEDTESRVAPAEGSSMKTRMWSFLINLPG